MNQQQATVIATAVHALTAALEAHPNMTARELIGAAYWHGHYESVACEREVLLETLATTTLERTALRETVALRDQQIEIDHRLLIQEMERTEQALQVARALAAADSPADLQAAQRQAVDLLVKELAPAEKEQAVA